MKSHHFVKAFGLISTMIAALNGLRLIGLLKKVDHPSNWAYNIGLSDVRIIGDVSQLEYYISLTFSFVVFVFGLWMGWICIFHTKMLTEQIRIFVSGLINKLKG